MAEDRRVAPEGYAAFLEEVKARIRAAQLRAALAVNAELLLLYWQIGRDLLARRHEQGWGARVIDRISADLRHAFPDLKGFSRRNLHYMRAFADAYPDEQFVQQVAAQLPWGHHMRILDGIQGSRLREWYLRQAARHGWSRDILSHQIQSSLHTRQGQALTNFPHTLAAPQSDLAQQVLKDPYAFDFLGIGADTQERDLERGLIAHIREFLLELGVGFAFVGSQHHLEVGGEDYYLDLLFYHLTLRCYVVIDLKIGTFQPEFAGKMNFYLSAVDDLLRHPDDQPSIGIILCKDKNRLVAEYALRDLSKPIGVAAYQLMTALPAQLRSSLPSIEELESELGAATIEGNDVVR